MVPVRRVIGLEMLAMRNSASSRIGAPVVGSATPSATMRPLSMWGMAEDNTDTLNSILSKVNASGGAVTGTKVNSGSPVNPLRLVVDLKGVVNHVREKRFDVGEFARGGDAFRTLQRKANPLKQSLFSIMIAQHEQLLAWLAGHLANHALGDLPGCAAGVQALCRPRAPRACVRLAARAPFRGPVFVFRSSLNQGARAIQDTTKRVRVNRQIRISPVRVIGSDGSQLGVMELEAAFAEAEKNGLDLVEVAAMARPPVVRIMDYGKYKFEQAKQARIAKKKQHIIELKEVKYRPGIDDHDFDTKTRHARRFLEEKNKVKVTMMFRGRQVAHPELGQAVLQRVAQELADVGKIESAGRLEGKSMTMILTPK